MASPKPVGRLARTMVLYVARGADVKSSLYLAAQDKSGYHAVHGK
jgi:hypothetical protein